MKIASLLCIAPLLWASPTLAETTVSLITPTVQKHDRNAPDPLVLEALLLSCLSEAPEVAVQERADDIGKASDERSTANGFVSRSFAYAPYKAVQYVISGSAASLGNEWLVTLQVNNPSTSQMVASHTVTLPTHYTDSTFCKNTTTPLLEKLKTATLASSADGKTQRDEDALLDTWMMQGITQSKNANYTQAFPFFLKVLTRSPDNADARYWLATSYAKAGLSAFASAEAAEFIARFPKHPKHNEMKSLIEKSQSQGVPAS